MKLINFEVYSIDAGTPAKYEGSANCQALRDLAAILRLHPDITEYVTYFAGDMLGDEGLIPVLQETLSLDDDYDQSDDLDYFYTQARAYPFSLFSSYRDDKLTVLYFTAD
jgi:hypothetical protein